MPSMSGQDLVTDVTCPAAYDWTEDVPASAQAPSVVAYDYGIKHNILRCLTRRGCRVQVVPAGTPAEAVLEVEPDGVFLSNGPGDPAALPAIVERVRRLIGVKPIMGICLGHQILALASGAETVKLKFGHHGGNQPIRDMQTERVLITAENHGFAVDRRTLPDALEVTHVNLNDNVVEGVRHRELPVFSCSSTRKPLPDPTTPTICLRRFSPACDKGIEVPKRQDLQTILLIGSGPIVIGQACEFDYSGVQACKALKEEGYRIVLVNNNPATIMTDPEVADRTYLEPLTPDLLEKVIARERPQALLPTMGGQTSLNLAVTLSESGVLERYNVELIGAKMDAIQKAEDRDRFKQVMESIGLSVPRSQCISHADEAAQVLERLGLPLIIRPSFTLGGSGGSVAYNRREYEEFVARGLKASPHQQVLIEESVLGWKEYELEVMRDWPTTSSSCVRSRTSMPWGCTPATALRWRRRRR